MRQQITCLEMKENLELCLVLFSTKVDETTTKQPDDEMQDIVQDDMEGSSAVRSELETGYGSPIDEKGPNVEKDNSSDGFEAPKEEDSVVN